MASILQICSVVSTGKHDGLLYGETDMNSTLRPRVMIASRSASTAAWLGREFEKNRFCVKAATSGLEGLRLLKEFGPVDLLIVELVLDHISGLALIGAARASGPCVILAVNNGSPFLSDIASGFGADCILDSIPEAEETRKMAAGFLRLKNVSDDLVNGECAETFEQKSSPCR